MSRLAHPLNLVAAMSRRILVALVFALVALPPFAVAADDDPDDATITAADIPKDAPRFEDYPAKPYTGPHAAPDVYSQPLSRRYRTKLREWSREKANFAGHYIVATWGCGTGCTQIAIIDAISGKVFHPPGARGNSIQDVDPDVLDDEDNPSPLRADFGALRYRADSRLLVLFGAAEWRKENTGISYFVWNHEKLTRIRFVPKVRPAAKK
jgi:hypothetical protein